MAAAAPTVLKVSDGHVVDYGLTWFRLKNNGEIIKRVASPVTGVKTKPLKPGEEAKARKALAAYLKHGSV